MSVGTQPLAVVPHDHVVQFYGDDAELVAAVSRFLRPAAQGSAVMLVIATAEHRAAVAAALRAAGADLDALRARGTFIERDAAATLAAFRRDGCIVPADFDAVVGGLVRDAAGSGLPVLAFGEMVAVLWKAGEVVAALELETLWNDLGRTAPFSLFCGYPDAAVRDPRHVDALHRLCHELHSSVVDPPELALTGDYPAERTAARQARRATVTALRLWGYDGALVDDAELIVGELAANAVLHARSSFTLRVRIDRGIVRIAVADRRELERGQGLIVRLPHGLSLVEALATRWGVDRWPHGKVVWAELAT